MVFASGMAAAATVFNRLAVGSHIVVPSDPYHGVAGIIAEGEAQGRWTVRRLDQADTAAWLDALQHCDLVWLESPENPLITVADLPTICPATPWRHDRRCRQHLRHAAESAATRLRRRRRDALGDQVHRWPLRPAGGCARHSRRRLYDEFHHRRLLHGATIGAMEAFLTIRGARTMSLRLDRAQQNAMNWPLDSTAIPA